MKPNAIQFNPEAADGATYRHENVRSRDSSVKCAVRLIRMAFAISVCSAGSISAGEWNTVDYLVDAFPTSVVSINGDVFVAGDGDLGDGRVGGVISKSSDHGETWQDQVHQDTLSFEAAAVQTVSSGLAAVEHHLVVSGEGKIKRSLDGGDTWEIVDQVPSEIMVRSVAIDNMGNIFVAGSGERQVAVTTGKKTTFERRGCWAVRRISRDAALGSGEYGKNTLFLDDTARGGNTWPAEVFCTEGRVIIAGQSGGYWHVKQSVNGGQNWATLDDFRSTTGYVSAAAAVQVDGDGNIWVAGYGVGAPIGKGRTAFHPYSWIVRKGVPQVNGTIAFTTVDTFELEPSPRPRAESILIDSSGNVYVTGNASLEGLTRWVTRRLRTGAAHWETVDNVRGISTSRIAEDSSGNIFIAGCTPENSFNWTVRRQLAD